MMIYICRDENTVIPTHTFSPLRYADDDDDVVNDLVLPYILVVMMMGGLCI
jgi:hypothetical protein